MNISERLSLLLSCARWYVDRAVALYSVLDYRLVLVKSQFVQ